MPKKKLDPCMFCGEVICECPGSKTAEKAAKKKSTSISKSRASSPKPASTSTQTHTQSSSVASIMDSTPAVDLKAAMKAAASNGVQQSEQSHSSTSVEGGVGEINGSLTPEEAAAISILEPLLAPDERAKYESELNRYFTPAQRWRIRRVG